MKRFEAIELFAQKLALVAKIVILGNSDRDSIDALDELALECQTLQLRLAGVTETEVREATSNFISVFDEDEEAKEMMSRMPKNGTLQ